MALSKPTLELNIHKWKINTMRKNNLCVILGQRGSGKTTFTKYLAVNSPYARTGNHIVFAGSLNVKMSWEEFVHPMFIKDADINELQKIIETQDRLVAKFKKAKQEIPDEYTLTIYLDDCGCLIDFIHSRPVKWLAANARNTGINCIIVLQHLYSLTTDVRTNIDYVYTFATRSKRVLKIINEEFLSCVESRILVALIQHVTSDKGVLVIDNTSSGSSIEKVCGFMRIASELKPGLYGPEVPGLVNPETNEKEYLGSIFVKNFIQKYYLDEVLKTLQETSFHALVDDANRDEIELEDSDTDNNNDEFSRKTIENLSAFPAYSDKHGRVVIKEINKDKIE